MKPLSEIIQQPKKQFRSKRDTIINDIYEVYSCERQILLRKKENWKRYIQWLKENRFKHSKENVTKFKKQKEFIKELPIRTIAILLARNKDERLYEILSEAKDMNNRGKCAGGFIVNNRFI